MKYVYLILSKAKLPYGTFVSYEDARRRANYLQRSFTWDFFRIIRLRLYSPGYLHTPSTGTMQEDIDRSYEFLQSLS